MTGDASIALRKRLRQLRLALSLSQEQFAERAGLNYKHYQEIERGGKTEVRLSTLERIADAFAIPIYHLFTEESPEDVVAEFADPEAHAKKPHAKAPKREG